MNIADTSIILEFCSSSQTILTLNLAVVRFCFKASFGAATIRGQLDFKGSTYRARDRHACVCTQLQYVCM